MFGKINLDVIIRLHRQIQEDFLFRINKNLCDDAKRHCQRGFLLRLGMMEEAIQILSKELSELQAPMPHFLSSRLTLFLNAYYLNLAGALDNLAWALIYQHSLISSVDENNNKHRKFALLTGKDFLKELRNKNLGQLADSIDPFHAWDKDMREFRDPAAHRIPLNVPPSVYSEDDIKQAQQLDKEASELIKKGQWDEGMNLLHQSRNLGQAVPIFISESPTIKIYDLALRVDQDHQSWLEIVMNVLKLGF